MKSCNPWPPPYRVKPLIVSVPGSILYTEHSLETKTLKIGIVARALSVFRVNEIIVYRDPYTSSKDLNLFVNVLRYLETPPHLRKRLIPLQKELRWVGILPPLRTFLHEPPKKPKRDDIIEGVLEEGCKAFLGEELGNWDVVGNCKKLNTGSRALFKVKDVKLKKVEVVEKTDFYKGFKVVIKRDIEEVISHLKNRGVYIIATSRRGSCINFDVLRKISELYRRRGLGLLFGGPYSGILDLVSDLSLFDHIINFIPAQGSKTVRTEEALWTTLSIINIITQ